MQRSTTSAMFRRARLRPLILALCSAGCMGASQAQIASTAMPIPIDGDKAVAGVASMTRDGTESNPIHNYTQTSSFAAWRFFNFNLGSNGTINNTAASSSAVTLYHVVSPNRSIIDGKITANNRLFILSPGGIQVNSGGSITAGSLVLAAKDLDSDQTTNNYEGMQKNPAFVRFNTATGGYGGYGGNYGDSVIEIERGATLTATNGGSIFLIADNIRNSGALVALKDVAGNGGRIGLIAAESAELGLPVGDSGFITLQGFDKMQSETDGETRIALNTGTIDAENGEVKMVGAGDGFGFSRFENSPPVAIFDGEFNPTPSGAYNQGTITAKGTGGKSGKVTLEGTSDNAVASNEGVIDVSAQGTGGLAGQIKMSARNVMVVGGDGNAELLATGAGGRITLDHTSAPPRTSEPTPQLTPVLSAQTERAVPATTRATPAVFVAIEAPETDRGGVVISNATINGGTGNVNITGFGGAISESALIRNGVTIDNSTISGGTVRVEGFSYGASGVSLNASTLRATNLGVYGVAEATGANNAVFGVNAKSNVVLEVGQGGRAQVHGLALGANGVGLRIQDLRIVTSQASQIALVGQSTGSAGPGLMVDSDAPGLRLHEAPPAGGPASQDLASTADIIIGASADASADDAILLGTPPSLRTTGDVNFKPMSIEANSAEQANDLLNTGIRVGANVAGDNTNFNVDPGWFNRALNGVVQPGMGTVIGSSGHRGLITVADGALDGAGNVSLQNQGQGSQGIVLGSQAQLGVTQLNLLTTGNVSQTGPIRVATLNIKAGPASSVQLANPGNRIGTLNFDGMTTAPTITPAATTNSGASGIPGFETGEGFQNLSIQAVSTNDGETIYEVIRDLDIDMTFEGTDLMNELRTDVYVHGQLSRPQLCTPANTSGGATPLGDSGADPLAQEWGKVRRGPQLTNCAGLRADSSCSAF
jgi:filamentous hemagglutinin family protein